MCVCVCVCVRVCVRVLRGALWEGCFTGFQSSFGPGHAGRGHTVNSDECKLERRIYMTLLWGRGLNGGRRRRSVRGVKGTHISRGWSVGRSKGRGFLLIFQILSFMPDSGLPGRYNVFKGPGLCSGAPLSVLFKCFSCLVWSLSCYTNII